MKRKTLCALLAAILCAALLMSACDLLPGKKDKPTSAAFDLKSCEGVYEEEIARRGVLELRALSDTDASIRIEWPSSAYQTSVWTLTGRYDAAQNAIVYEDATLVELISDGQGAYSENVSYTDGSGSFAVDGSKLHWTDNASVIQGSSSTFVYTTALEEYTGPQTAVNPAPTQPVPADSVPVETAAAPEPTPTPTPTPEPTPTPPPSPAPTPTDPTKLPKILKSPTNETVVEGGHCYFLAKYEDAVWAVWHFVSPDGTRDLAYDEAAKEFPKMGIEGGMYSQMKLTNIPLEISGWRVYCEYSNRYGAVKTDSAAITVNPRGTAAAGTTTAAAGGKLPKVTKSPTSETVAEGGIAIFQARYEDAIWAVWHFVSPDGTRDLTYEEAAKEFTKLQILNGNYSQLMLKSIPLELNGWKVYCEYSNHDGAVRTDSATITVTARGAAGTGTGTGASSDPRAPKITKSPTSETVAEGGSCFFVAKYENAVWAEWHFVSPDGTRDLTYEEAAKEFKSLTITGGMYSQMKLSNIPLELNGWKVYCHYSNRSAATDTDSATITVTPKGTPVPTAASPAPSPSPTPAAGANTSIIVTAEPAVTPSGGSAPYVADWTAASDLTQAVNGSGLSFSPPPTSALPAGMSVQGYRYKTGSIEVSYADGLGNTVTVRKSTAESGNVLSGDTNIYTAAWQEHFDNMAITCKGDGTTVNAATYGFGGSNYAIMCNTAQTGKGLTRDQLTAIITSMQ